MNRTITPMSIKSLMSSILLFLLIVWTTSAQEVTSGADDGSDGTLRNEIAETAAGGTITFAEDVTTVTLTTAITIDKNITIAGNVIDEANGVTTVIDANNSSRIFTVTGANLVMTGLTLQNGTAQDGGAIYLENATLDLTLCQILDSTADGTSGSGGGVYVGTNSTMTAMTCRFEGNTANRAGGAIEINNAVDAGMSLTLNNVEFNANNAGVAPATAAPGNGGAIHITGDSNTSITQAIFQNNVAASEGGGIWNGTGDMMLSQIQFLTNAAFGADANNGGGGLFNNGGNLAMTTGLMDGNMADGVLGSGGALLSTSGTVEITAVLLTNNKANRAGGAIEIIDGNLALSGSEMSTNGFTTPAPGNGGGLHVSGVATISITNGSVISNNTAPNEGGGLWNQMGSSMNISGATISGNIASGNDAASGGGGLFNNGGTIILSDSMIMNNVANGTSGSGGAIQNVAGGEVNVIGSTISGNTANRAGGGIEDNSTTTEIGTLTFTNVSIRGNSTGSAPGNGGGLHLTGPGNATITSSTFDSNSATNEGGGLWIGAGTVNIMTSTFSGNTTQGNGGGVYNLNGTLTIQASTMATNVATGMGGGIFNEDMTPTTSFTNTIVALNQASSGMDIGGGGTIISNDYNIIGQDDMSIVVAQSNDQEGVSGAPIDPLVGPLADNGGSTMTHALLNGSPAYNAGNPATLFADQRGEAVFGGIRDIGSFEAQSILSVEELGSILGASRIYPNPTVDGNINLYIPSGLAQDVEVSIIEVGTGKKVMAQKINMNDTQLNLNGLSSGIYIVKLMTGESVKSLKMIVGR